MISFSSDTEVSLMLSLGGRVRGEWGRKGGEERWGEVHSLTGGQRGEGRREGREGGRENMRMIARG